ncbi:hypothetical protein GCM10007049_14580 [Echinicola pacifica]|uniref:DUF4421 domain-containing protein n=1 Tax=Echinicola pacifica TaxID=346377 RepID=A0A918PU30_9BACT|nr:DUF4421 domain-containing protein [Echinicola pacifica]GGZ22833.1 hypothetical protein GCM10007049_14580 [Echinicola pacifica]
MKGNTIGLGALILVVMGMILSPGQDLKAQVVSDSSYIESFPELVTGRYYFSRKYTGLDIKDRTGEFADLKYRPNSTLNMGVGASYNSFTLNLAYGFGFLNPDKGQGETKYLDAQVHAYPSKWAIDGFAQFYKGYHLVPEGAQALENQNFYYRPDMKVREIGGSVKYVFNAEKFSYKAAFLQTEWQKKSAGSLLAGLEMYGGQVLGDSSLIPSQLSEGSVRNFDKITFWEFGPNIGYAYTLVIDQHYFIMGSATANLGLNYTQLEGEMKAKNWSVNSNYFLKASAGYNSKKWAINANYVYNNVRLAKTDDFNNDLVTGNYRLNFIYRFAPGPKLDKVLNAINPYNYLK